MLRYWRQILVILFVTFMLVSGADAGGLYLYEVGTPDVGLAGAGYAARADDAATVFTNPAGMTRIDEPSVLMGAQPVYMDFEFSPDGNTSAAAATLPNGAPAKDGDTSGWMPAGGLYYVHPVNDRLRLGLSMNGYFGLSLDYETTGWAAITCRRPPCRRPPSSRPWPGKSMTGFRWAAAWRPLWHVGRKDRGQQHRAGPGGR
jgi:long-subunit fatty acid transport protein